MKVNTDAVLLGALAKAEKGDSILDIGTGTGVIALMLAQRFAQSCVDAVEIDPAAAETASKNFENSCFKNRVNAYGQSFQDFFVNNPSKKYDLIVSNPPFFLNSLKSEDEKKQVARHTDDFFFKDLLEQASDRLSNHGKLTFILPPVAFSIVCQIAAGLNMLLLEKITVHSFEESAAHRFIATFGFKEARYTENKMVIYDDPQKHSSQYSDLLKDFLIIF
ncbi:tRNA1(Val) (adenine(37)-N6)-methyltransferase [Daejeonella oryzae]|uniref:tRNA1(Val) (adenine(37)-N6)-methyltransferase n=1 Tax=Daejeonella oryzae TaxID=1122943 RepID=UPI0003F7A306|nr:methyltransferase [Daejeonella oryzae]